VDSQDRVAATSTSFTLHKDKWFPAGRKVVAAVGRCTVAARTQAVPSNPHTENTIDLSSTHFPSARRLVSSPFFAAAVVSSAQG